MTERSGDGTTATDVDERDGRSAPSSRAVVSTVRAQVLGGDRPYVIGFVAALGLAVVVVSGPVRTWAAQRDLVETREATLSTLEAENDRLEGRVEDLNDPDTVEEQAREELGMYRPGEVPYVVVPPKVDQPQLRPERQETADQPSVVERLRQAIADVFG